MSDKKPRVTEPALETRVSGIEAVVVNEDTRPTVVGERTNVLGSRRFQAADSGRTVRRSGRDWTPAGSQRRPRAGRVSAGPDRDETADVIKFLDQLNRRVKAPIMVDSTDAAVIEESLKRLQGKVHHQLH